MATEPPADPAFIRYLNFLRGSELMGVDFLLRIHRLVRDPEILAAVHRHLAEEAVHARLWANAIVELGGALKPESAFQRALSAGLRKPRGIIDVLALNVLVEERAMRAYCWHASRPGNPPRIQRVLEHLIRDEAWHIEWQQEWLAELGERRGVTVEEALDRYRSDEERAARASWQAYYRSAFAGTDLDEVLHYPMP